MTTNLKRKKERKMSGEKFVPPTVCVITKNVGSGLIKIPPSPTSAKWMVITDVEHSTIVLPDDALYAKITLVRCEDVFLGSNVMAPARVIGSVDIFASSHITVGVDTACVVMEQSTDTTIQCANDDDGNKMMIVFVGGGKCLIHYIFSASVEMLYSHLFQPISVFWIDALTSSAYYDFWHVKEMNEHQKIGMISL